MAIEADTPLDLYRANLGLALRMMTFGYESRQQACGFEMQRVKRDLAALNATREGTSRARDWSELASSYQTMLRDYLATTINVWQQGLIAAARQQSACNDGMRDTFARWQTIWTSNWQKSTGIGPITTPLQDWLRRFEQAVADAPHGHAALARRTDSTVPSAGANGRGQQGEQHVG